MPLRDRAALHDDDELTGRPMTLPSSVVKRSAEYLLLTYLSEQQGRAQTDPKVF